MAPSAAETRVRVLVTAVIAGGALTVVAAVVAALGDPVPTADRVAVVAVLVLLGGQPLLHLRWGHQRESFNCAELGLVVGLAVLPLPWLVVIATLGTVAVQVTGRVAPVKATYNAATTAIGVGVSGGLVQAAADPASVGTAPVATAVALVAVLGYTAWTGVSVAAAVALTQGLPVPQVFADGWRGRLLVGTGNTVLGLGLLAFAAYDPNTLVTAPLFLGLLFVAYRAYLAASAERDTWRRLDASSRAVARLGECDVVTASQQEALRLFRADRVEVVVERPDGPARFASTVDGAGQPRPGVSTWASVALEAGDTHLGELRVGLDGAVRLTARERAALDAFGRAVGAAVQNARLYDEVRLEAQRAAHAATHDDLTGLPLRGRLEAVAQEAFAQRGAAPVGLVLVDLDHFREINETLGHDAGDRLLQEVARRLQGAVRPGDVVARLGGDEFALLLRGLDCPAEADEVAGAVLRLLAEPMEVVGLRLALDGSVGVATHPQDAATPGELLQRAEVALFRAKGSRGSWRHYDPVGDDATVQRQALVAELRGALDRDEIVAHFQPQLDLATGEVVSAEALARWVHPHRGLLDPVAFVPAAEGSGLVRAFTMAVLDKAVGECADWRRQGRTLPVAVNLSARSLLDLELPRDVAGVLRRHGLPGELLVIEITETTVMSELEVVEEVLAGLRGLGVRLSVDDFGTGYSSLAFLRRVAVHEIKVDQSFVRGMTVRHDDAVIVGTTVQLGAGMGLRVVAEGVESEEHRSALLAAGCRVGQGYHLCRPLPAEGLRALLELPQSPARGALRLA